VHSLCKSLRIAAAGVEDNFDDRHRFQNGGIRSVDRFRLSVHRLRASQKISVLPFPMLPIEP
jgi:hypothetical protein